MPRSITLFSGAFADLSLAELASKASEWGYAGLELAVRGDHLSIIDDATLTEECSRIVALLNSYNLHVPAVAAFGISQAIGDKIDSRHQAIVPKHVWGDGDVEGVRNRAIHELKKITRATQQLGGDVVVGFTGSPLWSYSNSYPGPAGNVVDSAYAELSDTWQPILDVCQECGIRFALEVHLSSTLGS